MFKIAGRFLLPLMAVLAALAWLCMPYTEHLVDRWFERDVQLRSELVFDSIQDNLEDSLASGNAARIQQLFHHITQGAHVMAIGYCGENGQLPYRSGNFPADFSCDTDIAHSDKTVFTPWKNNGGTVLIGQFPVTNGAGTLVILNDLGFIEMRHNDAHKAIFAFLLVVCFIAAFVTVAVAYVTLRGWLNAVRLLFQIKNGEKSKKLPAELKPLILDFYRLLRRRGYRQQKIHPTKTIWESDSLQQILKTDLPAEEIIVVSNREPYIHHEQDGQITMQMPAGGLTAALEPVMRACKGTWIAHGSGSGDRATVDHHDRIGVPPEKPAYTLRRVWLSEEEESGYYFGFANEGLWPLCHLVFTRPMFREEDWAQYQAVNRKFADAIVAEAKTKSPIVLVQDYHFALLPEMIHERLPNAVVATFWHIPWPNAEAFSICPWREEILRGLLGSDILGFHTQFHCNNFFETADRFLECRIDRERATVTRNGHNSLIRPYPISIEWLPEVTTQLPPGAICRENLLQHLQLPAGIKLGVGVERFDYTKGIMDRFQAIARFFRQHPEWIGRFSFVQVAAPTRKKLQRYRAEEEETVKLVEAINAEFGRDAWKPIILILEQYDQRQVFELFRASDLCIVSSLHDGMNLVAKEFVAAREDERGVLILSTFAGASEELLEALIVNPHDTKGVADAIMRAIEMPVREQEQRMKVLRSIVREHNIFWWAGQMLLDVARVKRSRAISASTRQKMPRLQPIRTALIRLLAGSDTKIIQTNQRGAS